MSYSSSHSNPPTKAVAAGTAAGLRHIDRVYVAKVNAMIADDRTDMVNELAADHARITDQPLDDDQDGIAVRFMRRIFAA